MSRLTGARGGPAASTKNGRWGAARSLAPLLGAARSLAPLLGAASFLACCLSASSARGGTFTPSGVYVPAADAVAVDDFEAYPAGAAGAAGSGGAAGQAGAAGEPIEYALVDDATALTGQRVMKLNPYQSAGVGVDLPAGDGSYVARVWVKREVVATVEVEYADGTPFVMSQLFPTGRVTSDGWLELESAPFSVEAARGPSVGVGFFAPGGASIDALEIVRGGVFRTIAPCAGLLDEACAPDEVCLARRCIDARGFVPPLPSVDERAAVVDYLAWRIKALFGPYEMRAKHLGAALAQLEEARTTQDRYRFWFAFVTAVRRLSDSHTTTQGLFQFVYSQNPVPGRTPLNVCFVGGEADLTQQQAPSAGPIDQLPDVLVSHGGKVATWGLQQGDRLVAVDGMHPLTWARQLIGRAWSGEQVDDPTSHAHHLEGLRGAVASHAATVTVVRCHGSTTCDPPETLEVAQQKQPDEAIDGVACDNRPAYHLPGAPENHGIGGEVLAGVVTESEPGENIHGIVWDSLYGPGGIGQQLSKAASSWKKSARGVILDHRTGNGGTADAAMPLLAFVSPQKFAYASVWRRAAGEEGPATKAEGLALFEQFKGSLGNFGKVGSTGAMLDVPVALIVTRDVSASDYFPYAFKGSPNAKIFGPHPTNGAFSSFCGLSYWLSISYQLAAGDTVGPDGASLTGRGATPDVVVVPKQSDLVAGKDTLHEAALAWVRANLKKGPTP